MDKSTELLNPDPDPIKLERVINYLDGYTISSWLNSQIDDAKYCERKIFRQAGVQQDSAPGTDGRIAAPPTHSHTLSGIAKLQQ